MTAEERFVARQRTRGLLGDRGLGPDFDESGRLLKDDWFVHHFDHDHSACVRAAAGLAADAPIDSEAWLRAGGVADCEAIASEIHELCCAADCRPRLVDVAPGYAPEPRPGPCPFHPPACECSLGECQK